MRPISSHGKVAMLSILILGLCEATLAQTGPPQDAPATVPVAVDPPPAPPTQETAPLSGDFQNCDGFGPPTRVGDGMTQQATGFWVAGGDRVRRSPTFRRSVASCDRALASLQSQSPGAWMRHVSLLQARALHRINEGDAAGALADLDLADQSAVESNDAHYLRSLNVNTNFIRAFALVEHGDAAAGEALAMATWRRRPYSRETIAAALTALGPSGTQSNLAALLRAAARMDPSQSGAVFDHYFEAGRFEEALLVYAEMSAPIAINDQTFDMRRQINDQEQQRVRTELFWLDAAGRRAYALAALGRAEEARTALADAQTRLDGATPAPPPLPTRPSNRDRVFNAVREQANLEIQSRAPQVREAWSGLVNARIAVAEGRAEDAQRVFDAIGRLPPSHAVLELGAALQMPSAVLNQMRSSMPRSRNGLPAHSARELFAFLLDAETATRAEARMGAIDSMFTSRAYRERGGCEERERPGVVNVCFKGFDATLAVTEERALLRAAARALENGGRFRIESRMDIQHSIVSTMYGAPISETQAGYESSLDVKFFSTGETCDRCIDAAEVQASLASIYPVQTGPSR